MGSNSDDAAAGAAAILKLLVVAVALVAALTAFALFNETLAYAGLAQAGEQGSSVSAPAHAPPSRSAIALESKESVPSASEAFDGKVPDAQDESAPTF